MQRRSSGPASEADPASRLRSGGHASTPRASGRRASVELALSTRQSQPCELHSASPPRSSGRTPGGDPLEGERGRRLRDFLSRCDSLACALSQVGSLPCPCKCRLRRNTREFDASGRVLRLKRYLASDVGGAVLDAVLDALAVNTRVEVLYIQNFEKGFDDHTLMKLLAVLKLRRIWAVNVGENFGVSLPAWRVFTAGLRHTNVQFMYASEHHFLLTDLKNQMRDAIRVNRQAQGEPHDVEVIKKVGNMWFNPRLPKEEASEAESEAEEEEEEEVPVRRRLAKRRAASPARKAVTLARPGKRMLVLTERAAYAHAAKKGKT